MGQDTQLAKKVSQATHMLENTDEGCADGRQEDEGQG